MNLHKGAVSKAVFSPDGKLIVTGGMDQQLIIAPTPMAARQMLENNPLPSLTREQQERWGLK